jgi:protein ImuA
MGVLRDLLRSFDPIPDEVCAPIPFGIPAVDDMLGGGLMRGALHEIAPPREPDITAATGFALALAAQLKEERTSGLSRQGRGAAIVWIAEDISLLENGAPHGTALDLFDLAPERLIHVTAAKPRDVLWAMEEALHCRAVAAVIGEIRGSERGVDLVATRRLSLATAAHGGVALLLRTAPARQASSAATRWIVGAARSVALHGPGPPTFDVRLTRNRRGPLGAWMMEFSRDQRFILASAHPEPVARTVLHRPHRAARAA